MVDYSERRPVNTNRPKKQGMARYFVLTALGGFVAGFVLCLIGSMILFKQFRQEQNVLKAKLENTARPVPVATLPPQQAPVTGTPDPNLSFYKTLPGGKGTLGTGLNPDKPENPAPRPTVTLPPPASPPSAPAHTASQPQQPAIRPPQPPMSTLSEHYDWKNRQ
jgi:hypothetical protein